MTSVTPYLWFNDNAEEAIEFYSGIFADVKILESSRYSEGMSNGGALMTATIELAGQRLILLNGGPMYQFTEAFSLFVSVDGQDEVDHYWNALTADGEESQCGWLKDKFGLSWQIAPTALMRHLSDADRARAGRAMQAMLGMRNIVIAELDAAADAG